MGMIFKHPQLGSTQIPQLQLGEPAFSGPCFWMLYSKYATDAC